jgi:hypothetical protein
VFWIEKMIKLAKEQKFKLVYVSVKPDVGRKLFAAFEKKGIKRVDRKAVFERKLAGLPASSPRPEIRAVSDQDTKLGLENLALSAGQHSRFKIDPRFPKTIFEALYREWMKKSLNHTKIRCLFFWHSYQLWICY